MLLRGGLVRIDGQSEEGAGPEGVDFHIGGSEVLSYDSVRDTLWFTGDEQSTIYSWHPGDAKAKEYQLPTSEITGARTHCIGTPDQCPDKVTIRTLVGTLEPDGRGNVYFADQTQNRIGVLRPDR